MRPNRIAGGGTWRALACLVGILAVAVPASAQGVEAQLKFGVDMARRGLWSEALFRFRQAERIDASNPRVLNNLAVAYEALGMFDEALDAYQRGLKLAPGSKELKQNYSRFVEFYQSFTQRSEEAAESSEEADESSGEGGSEERGESPGSGGGGGDEGEDRD